MRWIIFSGKKFKKWIFCTCDTCSSVKHLDSQLCTCKHKIVHVQTQNTTCTCHRHTWHILRAANGAALIAFLHPCLFAWRKEALQLQTHPALLVYPWMFGCVQASSFLTDGPITCVTSSHYIMPLSHYMWRHVWYDVMCDMKSCVSYNVPRTKFRHYRLIQN